jgi:hypothetical protein
MDYGLSSVRGSRTRPLSGAYAVRSFKSDGAQLMGSQGVSPQGTAGRFIRQVKQFCS